LKILTHPNLTHVAADFADLRPLLLDVAPLLFALSPLVDLLCACFFFHYSHLRLLHMCYLAETLSLLVSTHLDSLMASTDGQKVGMFNQAAEVVVREYWREVPGEESDRVCSRGLKVIKEVRQKVIKYVKREV